MWLEETPEEMDRNTEEGLHGQEITGVLKRWTGIFQTEE